MDIDKILEGRKIIETYREIQGKPHEVGLSARLQEDIKALGFENHQAFYDANEAANYRERVRCYAMIGECDHCVDRVVGCFPACRDDYAQKSGDKTLLDKTAAVRSPILREKALSGEFSLEQLRKIFNPFYHWMNYPGNVPPGCAHSYEKLAEPGFDIYWGMQGMAIGKEEHEEKRSTWGINKVKVK